MTKRSRTTCDFYIDEVANQDMQLDDVKYSHTRRAIQNLNSDELKIAQSIAKEALAAILFIAISIPSTPEQRIDSRMDSKMDSKDSFTVPSTPTVIPEEFNGSPTNFLNTPTRIPFQKSPVKQSTKEQDLIEAICHLILKQGNGSPSRLSWSLSATDRSDEILDCLKSGSDIPMLSQQDTVELFRVLIMLLRQIGPLIHTQLQSVCQGILAINQATGLGRKAGGTAVKGPTSMVKDLVRNLLLLQTRRSRRIAETLVKFICAFSQRVSLRTRNLWARQLSLLFSNALMGGDAIDTNPGQHWKAIFFELLIHSHGLHAESRHFEEQTDLWTLDEKFTNELSKRYTIMKTPSRRTKHSATPRRSVFRGGNCKGLTGASIKRTLFKTAPKPQEPGIKFLMLVINFLPLRGNIQIQSATEISLDREIYCKRLRLK